MRFPIRRLLAVAGAIVLPVAAQAQATISGQVTAEGGTPVVGASVFLDGLQIGAQTTESGRYNILVPAARATGQTVNLSVRSIGYRPVSQPVTLTAGATITRDFALVVNPLRLGEVVVTGAGTTSTREKIGTVINSVDSTLLRRAAEPQNVVSALAGKAPNVEIRTQSGEPGASSSIRIRGATSVTGTNQPLFVVDGQPIDNTTQSTGDAFSGAAGGNAGTVSQNRAADINPNDIESVEILKGAGAAAIYGARAANGVILITTKRGRAGQTRYSLQSLNSFDSVDPNIPLQRTYGQGTGGVLATCSTANCRPAVGGVPQATSWGAKLPAGTRTYDHIDEIYDTGTTLDNNLTMSGGTDRTTFFLSGGLLNQKGVLEGPNNDYTRTSIRLKGTHALFSNFNVGGNFNYVDTRGNYVQKGSNTSGLLLGALRSPPEFDNQQYLDTLTGLHRSYRFRNPTEASLSTGRGYDNPFFTLNNSGNSSELGRFIGNVNLDWSPLEWLTARYTLGSDYYNDVRLEALPFTSSSQPRGSVIRFDNNNLEIDHNLTLTGRRTFSENLAAELTLGQNLNSRRYRQQFSQGLFLIAPQPFVLQNTLSVAPPQEFKSLRHIEAYFARATVDLFNQLFITAGIRNDGFSTFGEADPRANYPQASVAWQFTNALGNTDQTGLLSYGKLRASYGETGREPPVYATITALSVTTQFGSGFGDIINSSQSGQGGIVTSTLRGNTDLKPERNREAEFGFDLGFLDQRVDFGATYYTKRSTDVILQLPINAGQTGALSQLANAAVITNKGVELTLNARPVTTNTFAWDFGVNFGRNRGRVERLSEGTEFISYNTEGFTGSIGSSSVGFAPGVLRGFDFVRCGITENSFVVGTDANDNDITLGTFCANAPKGALFIEGDLNQPLVDPTERVIADPNPKWTAGINSSIRLFNRIRLSGLLDIRRGGQVWNGTRSALYNFGTHQETAVNRERTGTFGKDFLTDKYPTVVGPGAGQVAFADASDWEGWYRGEGGSFGSVAAQFIEDGDFVKLRELALSYSADQRWVRDRLGLTSIDFRLAGRNLKTWTDYRGLDPEANLGGAEFFTQGIDFFNNPQTRSVSISIGLNR